MVGVQDRDEDLVRRFREGDDEAGTVLFERLFPALRRRLRGRIGTDLRPRVGESDLIQSAFASVLRRLDEFRDGGPGSFRRWLAGILDHKLIDEVRRSHGRGRRERGRGIAWDALSELEVPQGEGESPSRAAASAEDYRRIRAAVELLAPDHRTVVRLLHERGLSMAQAAMAMGRTHEAVRKLYARALERLSVLLAQEGES